MEFIRLLVPPFIEGDRAIRNVYGPLPRLPLSTDSALF